MGQWRDVGVPSSHILCTMIIIITCVALSTFSSPDSVGSVDLSHTVFSGMQQRSTVKYRARNEGLLCQMDT